VEIKAETAVSMLQNELREELAGIKEALIRIRMKLETLAAIEADEERPPAEVLQLKRKEKKK
jgi:hypothetical protein